MLSLDLNSYSINVSRNFGDIAIWQLFGFSVLLLTCFFNLVSLDAAKDEIRLDGQVWLKLLITGACGLYGVLGFVSDNRIRKTAFSFPAAWVLVIFVLYVVASLPSVEPTRAIASSFSILCVYLMTITAVTSLGKENALTVVFLGAGLFVLASWLTYFFVPSIGVMKEPIAGGEFVERMGGLSHPNTLGQFAGVCCLTGIGLLWSYGQRSWSVYFFVGLSIFALIFCYSRTAIVATMAGFAVAYRGHVFSRANLKWMIGFLILITFVVMIASVNVDFDHVARRYLSTISKSGDAEEIVSATGRIEIWSQSIRLIEQKPILGYGPASSKYLLEEYSLYTHNLWLNVGLSCGVGGLLIAITMCLSRIKMLFRHFSPVIDGLAVFIMVNGLFENIIFSNLCGLPTVCWVLSLCWFDFDESVS